MNGSVAVCVLDRITRKGDFSLERFKNQPTILEIPTPLTITRQYDQALQRNGLNSTTLLANTNKQPHLTHEN